MRFYNSDGSIKVEDNDASFGWSFDWIEDQTFCGGGGDVDEVLTGQSPKDVVADDENQQQKNNDDGEKRSQKREEENSAPDYSSYNLEMKHKEELTDFLMEMDNAESHLLLSIVNNAFHKILVDSRNVTRSKVSGKADLELAMKLSRRKKLQKLGGVLGKAEKKTSLLAELNRCDLVTGLDDFKMRRVPGEGNCDGGWNCSERREAFERIGLPGDIDKTLRDFFDKTWRAHVEAGKIGKCFREIDTKISAIEKEAREFRRDVCEMKFLDDVLALLDDKFDRVGGRLPFRNVGKRHANLTEELNLII